MKNKEIHILYILHIPKLKAFKVGISEINRINNRYREIERSFGKINKKKSFLYHSESAKTIKKIEQGIHTISWKFAKEIKINASGKTEFFKDDIEPFLKNILKTSSKMYDLKGPIRLTKKNKHIAITIFLTLIFLLIAIYFFPEKSRYINIF